MTRNNSLVNQQNKGKKELVQDFNTVGNDEKVTPPADTSEATNTPETTDTQTETPEETTTPEITSVDDIFATIENKPKKKKKKPVTIYLDSDVATAFNQFGKQYGKGARSELLNTFLKSKFLK